MDGINNGAITDDKTHLDSMSDFLVLRVGGVPSVSHAPFVHTKLSNPLVPKRRWMLTFVTYHTTRFQALENFAVDALKIRGVAGGLNGIDFGLLVPWKR